MTAMTLNCCSQCGSALYKGAPKRGHNHIASPGAVAKLTENLADERQEHFVVVALDCRNRLLETKTIGIGSLVACPVEPREVFNFLISVSAAKAVVVHNHPSGDPAPSDEDRVLTRQLKAAGELVGIPIVDHVIVAREGYLSFGAETVRARDERVAA